MPNLRATIDSQLRESLPGDFRVRVTLTNAGSEPVRFNPRQAGNPSLVLEVRDSQGEPVLMPPPSIPSDAERSASITLGPGESQWFEYGAFLDRSQAPGGYRVRYFGDAPELGGSSEDPLASEWLDFQLLPGGDDLPTGPPLQVAALRDPEGFGRIVRWLSRLLHKILCLIKKLLGKKCKRRLSREVDEARSQTITNAPAADNRNGTYGWRARFRVTVDEKRCTVTVLVRIRLVGAASTAAQRTAIETAIESRWNNRFKLCCVCCCCKDGYDIVTDVEFVDRSEHQVVNLQDDTDDMTNWARNNTFDIPHEFGHMLGALDEYNTVNGTDFGNPSSPNGTIMNNSANNPVARHYDLIRDAVRALLGTRCVTRARSERC